MTRPILQKVIDFLQIHLNNKKVETKNNKLIYLILDEFPNYFLEYHSNVDSHTYRLYFQGIINFITKLNDEVKKDTNIYFIEPYKDSPNRQYVPKKIKNILHDLGKRCAELLEIPKPYEIFSGIMILKPDYRYNVIHTDS